LQGVRHLEHKKRHVPYGLEMLVLSRKRNAGLNRKNPVSYGIKDHPPHPRAVPTPQRREGELGEKGPGKKGGAVHQKKEVETGKDWKPLTSLP